MRGGGARPALPMNANGMLPGMPSQGGGDVREGRTGQYL
jgi:hypothetical protein